MPGFIGFGTSQSDLGYVPAIQGAEEIDSLVDSDFRMVLRKLSKKDVTTKLKASFMFFTKMIKKILLLEQNVIGIFYVKKNEQLFITNKFFYNCTFFWHIDLSLVFTFYLLGYKLVCCSAHI